MRSGAVALRQHYCPLLLPDIHKDYVAFALRILPHLLTTTVLLLGEGNFGETPLLTIWAFTIARYHTELERERAEGSRRLLLEIPRKCISLSRGRGPLGALHFR